MRLTLLLFGIVSPRKGGPPRVSETLRKSPGLEDISQGRLALGTPGEVNVDVKTIATLEPSAECKGNLLQASVDANGQYTVTNPHKGFSKTYRGEAVIRSRPMRYPPSAASVTEATLAIQWSPHLYRTPRFIALSGMLLPLARPSL